MDVNRFKKELFKLSREIRFIKRVFVVDETVSTLKIKLVINRLCFIQVYVNFSRKIKSYTLVFNGQRLFGVDCDDGRWHEHPWNNPDEHKFIREQSIREVMFDIYNVLSEKGVI
ncbi:hypothetical protein HZB07_01375 [Candidatus Saganbacteria bacterium]|nr:hypothetical protein [Candidatus Saganbacteria bacterium]